MWEGQGEENKGGKQKEKARDQEKRCAGEERRIEQGWWEENEGEPWAVERRRLPQRGTGQRRRRRRRTGLGRAAARRGSSSKEEMRDDRLDRREGKRVYRKSFVHEPFSNVERTTSEIRFLIHSHSLPPSPLASRFLVKFSQRMGTESYETNH